MVCRRRKIATSRPLDYDRVYRLKQALPDLPVIINGGIGNLADAKVHLLKVDGVMLGRGAYQEPWRLLTVDPDIFGEGRAPCDHEGRVRCDDALYRA